MIIRHIVMNIAHASLHLTQGRTFDVSEKVPFRLTPNLVDALGATGVDGVFRRACEITIELLRENKDSLTSVLEAFIHDPLVEWQDQKRREVSLRTIWEAPGMSGN